MAVVDRWFRWATRDLLLFVIGLAILIHEVAIWDGPERITLIVVSLLLMGVRLPKKFDEVTRKTLNIDEEGEDA